MPNHVINEIVFTPRDMRERELIVAACCDKSGKVDFEVLLPIPLNCWRGSSGSNHERAFRKENIALNWCTQNWGTKWGPYGDPSINHTLSEVTISFQTAWSAPYGWLCALFNHLGLSFRYAYFSEGNSDAYIGHFSQEEMGKIFGDGWKEEKASDSERDRLGGMLWGEEVWKEISERRTK